MTRSDTFNGGITAEQFLFYEIRIAAGFYLEQVPVEAALPIIQRDNLFQYPTERHVPRMVRACYKRLDALGNENLRQALAYEPAEDARQINLYAMMRCNRLVWEFMTDVIGEKYRCRDLSFTKKDLNTFFSRLQAQNDEVAAWSSTTIAKIGQVLTRALSETGMLDSVRAVRLNPILISSVLEEGIRSNQDEAALAAFNCF